MVILLWCICPMVVFAQDSIKELERALNDSHGVQRLKLLNQITAQYLATDPKKGLKYARQATTLADNIFKEKSKALFEGELSLHPMSYLHLGQVQFARGKYYDAQQAYNKAMTLAQTIEDEELIKESQLHLSSLDTINVKEGNVIKNTFGNLRIGEKIKDKRENLTLNFIIKQAKNAESQKHYLKAIEQYEKAIEILSDQGDHDAVTEYAQQIAMLYGKIGDEKKALDHYELVLDRKEQLNDTTGLKDIQEQLAELRPPIIDQETPWSAEQKEEITKEKERYRLLAESSEEQQDLKKSLEYYKLYTELNNRLKDEEQTRQMALREKTYQLEKRSQEVALLKSEKEVQSLTLAQQETQLQNDRIFKRNLTLGILFLLLTTLFIFFLYRGKKGALGKLNLAYGDLKLTQEKLVSAESRIKRLLHQQVSQGVAQQLLSGENTDQAKRKFVCVMFLDIRDFTPFAEQREPEEIIRYQNDVFSFMIDIIDQHKGIINQFLGDGFMATFGLQDDEIPECENAFQAAKEIITKTREKSQEGTIPETRLGIGLHAGNVVVGNVGTAIRKQYSITGNTVITAARIEQLNKEFKSQLLISREVFDKLNNPIEIDQDFTEVIVKGRKKPVELLKIV
ncbi:adenylate/guanylate cyclase domain-containing protein [Fulvivirgaceae bacterium BMA10]|uniref:Adenylate/guanylate cyclase domain-containing protein n=1 Tax=Splendidivirga corallicola TaxID=3051826 RepID=A0ABT8KUV6_9BACT|nr:adenylate/guanylate cyclase domain-containing protein [Fulvivirgaceae bacterium BMA10]